MWSFGFPFVCAKKETTTTTTTTNRQIKNIDTVGNSYGQSVVTTLCHHNLRHTDIFSLRGFSAFLH